LISIFVLLVLPISSSLSWSALSVLIGYEILHVNNFILRLNYIHVC
jgi:hypothetical protein